MRWRWGPSFETFKFVLQL